MAVIEPEYYLIRHAHVTQLRDMIIANRWDLKPKFEKAMLTRASLVRPRDYLGVNVLRFALIPCRCTRRTKP